MTYGIKVYRDNGELALTDKVLSYVLGVVYVGSSTTVESLTAPIVFTRTDTPYVGLTQPSVKNLGANQWQVTGGYWSREVYPDNVHTSVSPVPVITMYIFVTKQVSPSGYGLLIQDSEGRGFNLAGDDKPLIIKKRLQLDPNTAAKNLGTSSRQLALGDAQGSWAVTLGTGTLTSIPRFTALGDYLSKVQYLQDSAGYFIGGITTHTYIINNILTSHAGQHTGPESSSNTQIPYHLPVWVIDTYFYDL